MAQVNYYRSGSLTIATHLEGKAAVIYDSKQPGGIRDLSLFLLSGTTETLLTLLDMHPLKLFSYVETY